MASESVATAVSSARGGMGAVAYAGGVTFRVWAKFAPSVAVAGDFNAWSTTANPLAPDGDSGYWSVDVPGAVAGQAYQFYIPGAPNNGYRVDPYATSVVPNGEGGFNAVVSSDDTLYDDAAGFTTPAWNQAVFYEIHIPTFSTQADGSPGDFTTALAKLPDLADLGINVIEIMPLGQFETLSSAGYNPGYIFAVESAYGGPDAFRNFVNQAHALRIAVIIDVVYNHLGGTDLWQIDGWFTADATCPYDQQPSQGGIYFYEDYRSHTAFGHSRFDFGRDEVVNYLCDNAARWLQSRFADGLRFDSVANIRGVQVNNQIIEIPEGKTLLTRINSEVQSSQPWKITIAEDLQGWAEITTPVDAGGFGFNAQWDDAFCFSLRNAVLPPDDGSRNIPGVANAIAAISGGAAFQNVIYTENHDRDDPGESGGRLPDMIDPGASDSWAAKKRSTLAAAVVLTSAGIPMLFQGQEFLEWAPFSNGGFTPQPIDWTGLRNEFAGIRSLYRDLIHLRRNWFNTTRGLSGANTHVLPVSSDNMLVYHRYDQGGGGDDVVVVCNFANQGYASYAIGLPRGGMWRVRLNSDANAYDEFFSNWSSFDTSADGPPLNGMPASGNISIAPYTCLILSQDN